MPSRLEPSSPSIDLSEVRMPADAARERRAGRRIVALCGVLALYLGLRALILHTSFDAVAIPNYELATIGNLARGIASGSGGAPWHRHFDNVGGHLFVAWLAVPLYVLLGGSYLTLKLVPLLLGMGTLLLVWRVLARYESARAALLATLLFAVAPPTLTKYSVIAKGNHFENLFFQWLFVAAFFRLHAGPNRARSLGLAGLAAGFAVSVYFGALVQVALFAALHVLVRGARASVRDAPRAGAGLALGLVPLFVFDLASGGRVQSFLFERLWANREGTIEGFGSRLARFFTETLPASACFEDFSGIPHRVADLAFVACFACASLVLAADALFARDSGGRAPAPIDVEGRRFERWKWLPFVAYLPVIAALVAAFDFPFHPFSPPIEIAGFRYLVPHFAFACIVIGIAAARLSLARARLRRIAGRALGVTALATGLFTLPIVDWTAREAGVGTRYAGDWFGGYFHVVLRDQPWDPAVIAAEIEGLEPFDRGAAYHGVAYAITWKRLHGAQSEGAPEPALRAEILVQFPEEYAVDLARGIGSQLRTRIDHGEEGAASLAATLARLVGEHDPWAGPIAEGLALDFHYPLVSRTASDLSRAPELRAVCPPELRRDLERGFGIACGRLAARGIRSDVEHARRALLEIERRWLADFVPGLGWGVCEGGRGASPAAAFDAVVPASLLVEAYLGFGAALRHHLGADEGRAALERSRSQLSAEHFAAVEGGFEGGVAAHPVGNAAR